MEQFRNKIKMLEKADSHHRQTSGMERLLCLFFCFIALSFIVSCQKDKDKDINFRLALNKKWLVVSQIVKPTWTFPETGKIYTDVFDFAKEFVPCVVDDYIVFYDKGTTLQFHNIIKCTVDQPEHGDLGTYAFDNATDSLTLHVPFEVPGQPTVFTTFKCRVVELTGSKLVLRYNQVLPITFTLHEVTQTYKSIP